MLECGFAEISTAAYIIPVFLGLVSPSNEPLLIYIKSDGREISTIEWQELENRFPPFFVHK